MSPFREISDHSETARPDRADHTHTNRAALLAVLHRYEEGTDTAGECLQTLRILGLVDDDVVSESRLPSAAAQARRRRRKAARDRAREEREAS